MFWMVSAVGRMYGRGNTKSMVDRMDMDALPVPLEVLRKAIPAFENVTFGVFGGGHAWATICRKAINTIQMHRGN
jgi:hypothetical protein